MPPAGKTEDVRKPENDFRTGFLTDSGRDRPARRGHQETARFPSEPPSTPTATPSAPSHAFCVGTLDLAPVSTSMRSVSDSVRQTTASVSANVRRKPPSIARRPHFDCAPLHLDPLPARAHARPPKGSYTG